MDGREHRWFVLISSVVPLLGVVAAVVLLWNRIVGPSDLMVFAVMYVIAGLGVSTDYHRPLTHRSFKAIASAADLLCDGGHDSGPGAAAHLDSGIALEES